MANPSEKIKQSNSAKKTVSSLSSTLNILGNVNRLRIFQSLTKHDKLTNQDIAKILKISNSLAKQHLYKLEAEKLITKRQDGPILYYSLNSHNKKISAIKNIVEKA